MTEQDMYDHVQAEADLSARRASQQAAMRSQMQRVGEKKHNPEFKERFLDEDLDSEKFHWLENEFSAWLSDAHPLANRQREEFGEIAELLDDNRANREITRHNPGRLLVENPVALAAMQGVDSMDAVNARPEWDSQKREAVRDVADVSTARKTLGILAEGANRLTTATTEHQTVEREQTDERSLTDKVAGVLD